MKPSQGVSLVVAAAVVGALAWWGLGVARRAAEGELLQVAEAPSSAASVAHEVPLAADPLPAQPAAEARSSMPAPEASSTVLGAPTPPSVERLAFVDARFVDKIGSSWSGVRLVPLAPSWLPTWNPGEGALSEADGHVRLQIALPAIKNGRGPQRREMQIDLVASRAGCTSVARSATLREGETSHLGFIVLGPGVRIQGRVVDADGKGIAQARLGIAPALLEGDDGQMARRGSPLFQTTPGSSSAADGTFTLDGVPPGKLRIWAHAKGYRHAWSEPIDVPDGRDVLGFTLQLSPLLPTDRIAGQVVDPDGAPLANVSLQVQEHSRGGGTGSFMGSDEEGRFEIIVEHDDSTYDFTAEDMQERFASQTVHGVLPGTLDVVIRLLAREQMLVRVLDADAAEVAGARFDVMTSGSMEFFSKRAPGGAYSIPRPGEPFILTVSAKGFRQNRLGNRREMLDPAHLPAELVIVLQRAKLLRGRVTADGVPVAGARVYIAPDFPAATGTVNGYRYRYRVQEHLNWEAITDADGRYQIDCDVKGGYDVDNGFWLRAMADDWTAAEVGPVAATQLDPIAVFDFELTRGGTIEGRVLLRDGRDAEGTIVALNHGDGFPKTIRAGAGGAFLVNGLEPGQWQVLHAKGEIDPDRTTFSGVNAEAPMEWNCEVRVGITTHFDLDLTRP